MDPCAWRSCLYVGLDDPHKTTPSCMGTRLLQTMGGFSSRIGSAWAQQQSLANGAFGPNLRVECAVRSPSTLCDPETCSCQFERWRIDHTSDGGSARRVYGPDAGCSRPPWAEQRLVNPSDVGEGREDLDGGTRCCERVAQVFLRRAGTI
jgi:hypothetical protein